MPSKAAAKSSGQATITLSIPKGPVLVGLAAMIWSTDILFRTPIVRVIHPVFIVLFEHLIGTFVVGIWALARARDQIFSIAPKTWFQLILVGAGGSALATVFFTASFQHINPSVAILLQKTQPVMVILFAVVFLKEIPAAGFWRWAGVALLAAIGVSFPDLDFHFLSGGIDWHSLGVLYALGAAALWALATVAGKSAVNQLPPSVVTFWRYFFGLCTLTLLMFASGESIPYEQIQEPHVFHILLYMAFMPGILALLCYYNGLKNTRASTATFIELLYPIGSVCLAWAFLKDPLKPVQVLAGIILLYAVTRISLPSKDQR